MDKEQKERIRDKLNEISKTMCFKMAKNASNMRKETKNEKE